MAEKVYMTYYKVIMVDGTVIKASFEKGDDIEDARNFVNSMMPFISVGDTIINLRYVKRIKRIKRLREYLPKFIRSLSIRELIVYIILSIMATGCLFMFGLGQII